MKSLALISCLQKLQYLSFVTTPKWWVCSILQPFYMLQNYPGWLNCQQQTLLCLWPWARSGYYGNLPSDHPGPVSAITKYTTTHSQYCKILPTVFLHQPWKWVDIWVFWVLTEQNISWDVWISLILWAVAGWWGWVMSHPEQRPSPASPHPALSFVVFQNREQQHLSSSLPLSPGTLLSGDRMLCDLHVAGFHVAQIRFLFWWPGHWLSLVPAFLSQEPVRGNNLLRSLRTRIQRAGAERPGLGCSPHTAGLYPGSLHAAGKKWRWSPVRLWHLLGSAHFLLAPVFVPGEVLVAPGLAWPQRHTCKPPWPRLPSLLSLIPHLTHHYPSKPSSISHFLFDILKLSMLKCYHLFSVKVSFSPYATNGDNLSQKCKKWYIDWRTKYMFSDIVSKIHYYWIVLESSNYQSYYHGMILLFTILDLNKSNVTTTKYQVRLVWDPPAMLCKLFATFAKNKWVSSCIIVILLLKLARLKPPKLSRHIY